MTAWTIGGGTVSGFSTSYDGGNQILTVTFGSPIRDDRLTVVVDYSITDTAGNELDGEIGNPANAVLPSGNGVRGGQAVFRFNILQGDVNRDGVVNVTDGQLLQPSLGLCNDDSGYNVAADLNLDGCVNAQDLVIFSLANGRSLPSSDGSPLIVTAVTPNPEAGLLNAFTAIQVSFNEPIELSLLNPRRCFLITGSGAIIVPAVVGSSPFGTSAVFTFAAVQPQCGTYTVNISNALADLSGELLTRPPTPPVLTGLVPPPAPTLNAHTTMTMASQVTITGFAPGATWVEVSHPAGSFLAPVTNNAFSANVPLSPNRINPIFFTGLSTCAGVRGPQRVTRIVQDTESPNLYIDFPADVSQITTSATDVAGRVGDILSGFAGLTVTVNGISAVVDEGVGNNGTFFAPNVPLTAGQPNVLQVVATDALGNTRTKQITVTQAAIPANSPLMTIVSGNGQTAMAMTVLPQPIVVRMTHPNGTTPFVNKVVTFDVTRSDGRLGPTAASVTPTPGNHDPGSLKFQMRTDANGEARAYWRLGSDAGNGNNRVKATSLSIAGTVAFCASSTPMPVRQINIGTGNNQKSEAGAPAPEPLRAWVSDGCNGREAEQVRFTVVRGGGKVNNLDTVTVATDRTGHALVNFTLGPDEGTNVIEASVPAYPNVLPAKFTIYGLKRDLTQLTSFFGVVLNNAGQPIQNVKCLLVVGSSATPYLYTDINGHFRFDNVPLSGDADLYVDGSMATHIGGPTCTAPSCTVAPNTFPGLHYEFVIVPNAANSLNMPVMLPPLNPNNVVSTYSATPGDPDTILTVEGMKGLKMIVKAGSMTLGSGQPAPNGQPIYLNQVHDEDIPMPIPDGASPPFAWTLQPAGAKFDPPIEIHYPNMSGLPAGAIAYFLSFNHDTSRFEIIASGHVIADGSTIVTDPGVGLGLAGWGCNCPPYAVTGDCCTGCDECCDGGCCCGDACCAGPCCAGGCCAAGGSCCGGSCCDGPCCEETGECCPAGGSCCNGTCCDGPCCEETGECCPSGDESCCNNQCCAGPCCEGLCCPEGGSCCDGRCCAGPCCEETGECCPAGGSCCAGSCCAGPCCEATGECCPAGGSCCNNECCSGPCCENNCCDAGQSCCGEDCCESGKTCCNPSSGLCCAMGRECCQNMTMCCPYNQVCCNEGCCPAGQICCGNECCKPAKCCNNECCGPNEICCGNICETTDCSVSLDPGTVCPGETVELQGVAICNPECATMTLTVEVVEPVWQSLASVIVSPGSVACGPFKTPFVVAVNVSPNAQIGSFTVRVKGRILVAGDPACETTAQATVTVERPMIVSATEWLVVHDPPFERDHCQPTSIPRCKQAQLMTNEAVVVVSKPDAECEFTVWLVNGDTEIVEGFRVERPDTVEFYFRTVIGSTTGGAKTDASGNIYVENALLPAGPSSGFFGPDYEFELRLNVDGQTEDLVLEEVDVSIAPLLTDLGYSPNILANPLQTLDPYSDLDDLYGAGDPEPDGYGAGEYFGLDIQFDLDDDLAWAPAFIFYNDTSVPDWGGDGGITGQYQLFLDPILDADIAKAGVINKEIKWEGFTDNAVVRHNGFAEPGPRVFMEGLEAELPMPFNMGDGVMQSRRGVAPRYVVKEGHYVNEFRIRRKLDLSQWQYLFVPFEVKYEFE
ncbi:MAG: hypothetical protein A49_11380 [Methyloceanibacter sp.]|nr:MAG: hypothetical protein A49_11380 [Methyloceanibacter sp.]